jgi:hypothetical protein
MRGITEIQEFMEKMGIPGRDLWDLPTSTKTFPDGANYRMEIAGVERATTMEAMIQEARRRGITIHRAIATVGGSTYCDFDELKAVAQMGWDAGSKEATTQEGMTQGARLRRSDNISYWIADMMRNIQAGLRGFLVYDEGVLSIVDKMRKDRFILGETIFKFSVFGGYCSAAGARVIENLGPIR